MAVVLWTYNNPRVERKDLQLLNFPFCGQTIKIEQNTEVAINRHTNTNFKLWDGSFLLSCYIESLGEKYFKGKKCMELGAGCGLVGMVAAILEADVVLTDLPSAIDHTKHCLSLNKDISDHCRVLPYKWGDEISKDFENLDFIFASDVVYNPDLNEKLVLTFKLLCQPGTIVYLSYKKRASGEENFFEMLPKEGFCFEELHISTPKFENSDYKIFKCQKNE